MVESPADGTRAVPFNRLLAGMPPEEWEIVQPHLEEVPLNFKRVIYEPEAPFEYVYFPHAGVVSFVTEFEDGSAIEIATVGSEGVVGLPIFLEDEVMAGRALAQIPGKAARIRIGAFRRVIDRCPRLHRLVSRYTLDLMSRLA